MTKQDGCYTWKEVWEMEQNHPCQEKLIIFDTTLRDGAQTPGIGLNIGEKVRIAMQLEKLGVDIMEVGFPSSSDAEFDAVVEIAARVKRSEVAVLTRAREEDINRAWDAIKYAAKPRLQTFVSSSDLHIKHKLKMTKDEVLDMAIRGTRFAKTLTDNVQFGFEDGSRTDPDFLCLLCEEVIRAGATTVNIADTVGYALPEEFERLIRYVMDHTPNIHHAIVSVHCHDDLGLAMANTLRAIYAGARQVDVTMNGIGERAGNTSLEELVVALHTRYQTIGLSTNIELGQIYPTSRLVSMITGINVQPNKAVVGANAFSHESGIHQDGMLKNPLTYQIVTPESVGAEGVRVVLGKHSGRHGLQARLVDLGWHLTEEQVEEAFKTFKHMADRKKVIADEDLEAVIAECVFHGDDVFQYKGLRIEEPFSGKTTVEIEITFQDAPMKGLGRGPRPIRAVFDAIETLTGWHPELMNLSVNALSDGLDAQGEATVRLKEAERIVLGRGIDQDIIAACAKAYINGLNRLEYIKKHPILRTGEKWNGVIPDRVPAAGQLAGIER
jgi:2-isopropylmalate synthase